MHSPLSLTSVILSAIIHLNIASDGGDNNLSCYTCTSSVRDYRMNCGYNVSQNVDMLQECAPDVTECYTYVKDLNVFSRGCGQLSSDEVYRRNCVQNLDEMHKCSFCEEAGCNKADVVQETELRCAYCTDPEDCSLTARLSQRCETVPLFGRNMRCYIGLQYATGRVAAMGCMDDANHNINPHAGLYYWTCEASGCNDVAHLMRQDFSCAIGKGPLATIGERMRMVSCRNYGTSGIPGCYSILKGDDEIELGCNTDLAVKVFRECLGTTNKCQFCYTSSDCNQINYRPLNKCQVTKNSVSRGTELCHNDEDPCYIRFTDSEPRRVISSGCVKLTAFPYSDTRTFFCRNYGSADYPCNDLDSAAIMWSDIVACYQCEGPLCNGNDLGNRFKTMCPKGALGCYTLTGRDPAQRGCLSGEAVLERCERAGRLCKTCITHYCNDDEAMPDLLPLCSENGHVEPCTETPPHPGFIEDDYQEYVDPYYYAQNLDWDEKLTKSVAADGGHSTTDLKEFSCFQCHSDNFYEQSCGEDVRYLDPTPCTYYYGVDRQSCYILIHRGYRTMERGCGSALDRYTYETCDTDKFAECSVCMESGCNRHDMTGVLVPFGGSPFDRIDNSTDDIADGQDRGDN